jgi:hypothetical protein
MGSVDAINPVIKSFALASRVAAALALAGGCATEALTIDEVSSEVSVAQQASASGCSTAVVLGLSRQIADEVACSMPGAFREFSHPNIVLTSNAVLPYLQSGAREDLLAIAAQRTVQINSAFRTPPQQFLLREWFLAGRCGIAAAATVGRSNHESGRALDISGYSLATMTANDYAHSVPGDDPHFDHVDSLDLRGEDIRAFQRLWNRNNPNDPITVDGLYGPMTEARLRAAPATGFPVGADCSTTPPPTANERRANLVSIDGADRAPPSSSITYRIALANLGNVDWSSGTRLIVADGGSELQAPSWISGGEITALGRAVGAREVAFIDVDIITPEVETETVIVERLALSDGGETFGDIQLALTVVPDVVVPESGDGSEPTDEDGEAIPPDFGSATGGCSSGGGGVGWFGVALALLVARFGRRQLARGAR